MGKRLVSLVVAVAFVAMCPLVRGAEMGKFKYKDFKKPHGYEDKDSSGSCRFV